jgi:hypothetical protein
VMAPGTEQGRATVNAVLELLGLPPTR